MKMIILCSNEFKDIVFIKDLVNGVPDGHLITSLFL